MKIKIEAKNAAKIEAALAAANGGKSAHTYTEFADVEREAKAAHARAYAILGSLAAMKAVQAESTSGDSVPNAYKYSRTGTKITMICAGKEWYVVDIKSAVIFKSGGHDTLVFTADHDAAASRQLRSNYRIVQA